MSAEFIQFKVGGARHSGSGNDKVIVDFCVMYSLHELFVAVADFAGLFATGCNLQVVEEFRKLCFFLKINVL